LARDKVAFSYHGQHNPAAFVPHVVMVEQVLDSPLVADPLYRLDCCVMTGGGSSRPEHPSHARRAAPATPATPTGPSLRRFSTESRVAGSSRVRKDADLMVRRATTMLMRRSPPYGFLQNSPPTQ
jgi:acetyl-CoA acetyltransferase